MWRKRLCNSFIIISTTTAAGGGGVVVVVLLLLLGPPPHPSPSLLFRLHSFQPFILFLILLLQLRCDRREKCEKIHPTPKTVYPELSLY